MPSQPVRLYQGELNTRTNRQFPEITGKDNLTAFSYSKRPLSPEWRQQLRRADKQQFQIFGHGPIIVYTTLPAGGTCYPICILPTNSERLISISDAFSAFCLLVSVTMPTGSLYPHQKRACSALPLQARTDIEKPCLWALTECRPLAFRRSSIRAGVQLLHFTVGEQRNDSG